MIMQTLNFHEWVLNYIKQFRYTWVYSEFNISEVFLYDWSWNNAEELFKVWHFWIMENLSWDHELPPEKLAIIEEHGKHRRIMSALRWSYKLEELYNKEKTLKQKNYTIYQ